MGNDGDALTRQIDLAFRQRLLDVLAERDRAELASAFEAMGLCWEKFHRHPADYLRVDFFALLGTLNGCFPGIVLRFGMARQLLDLGALGYAVLCSRDLRQAMDVLQRYHRLTAKAYQWRYFEDNGSVVLQRWTAPGVGNPPREMDEEWLTGVWAMLRHLLPPATHARRLSLRLAYPAPEYAMLYKEYFPGETRFDQDQSELRFPASWLDAPIDTAEETLERACEAHCQRMMQSLAPGADVVDDVRRLLLLSAPEETPDLAGVAKQLFLSRRTLERRLQEAGTSFRAIDNEVRMSTAARYLELGYLSIQEISYLLGYSQTATFFRAFKNWFGTTPNRYRKDATQKKVAPGAASAHSDEGLL